MLCGNPECAEEIEMGVLCHGMFLCKLCRAMLEAIGNSPYWRNLHFRWVAEETERIKRFNRLKPGADYFEC